MCSVSWLLEDNGYQVFLIVMNKRARALAMLPKQYRVNSVDIIMPPIQPVVVAGSVSMSSAFAMLTQ